MAEREGFEPSVPFLVHTISSRAHSATLSPLHSINWKASENGAEWVSGQARLIGPAQIKFRQLGKACQFKEIEVKRQEAEVRS